MAKRHRLSETERTAFHEAGHAVVAYIQHRRFTTVSIVPEKDTLGHVGMADVSSFHPDIDEGQRVRRQVETRIMVCFGGLISEQLATGRVGRWKITDMSKSASLIDYIATTDKREGNAYMNWLWERTRVLLEWPLHWAAVEALATELVKCRHIGERRARKIIGEAVKSDIAMLRLQEALGRKVQQHPFRPGQKVYGNQMT